MIKVDFETLFGDKYDIEIPKDTTLKDAYNELCQKYKLNPNQYYICCNQKLLFNTAKINEDLLKGKPLILYDSSRFRDKSFPRVDNSFDFSFNRYDNQYTAPSLVQSSSNGIPGFRVRANGPLLGELETLSTLLHTLRRSEDGDFSNPSPEILGLLSRAGINVNLPTEDAFNDIPNSDDEELEEDYTNSNIDIQPDDSNHRFQYTYDDEYGDPMEDDHHFHFNFDYRDRPPPFNGRHMIHLVDGRGDEFLGGDIPFNPGDMDYDLMLDPLFPTRHSDPDDDNDDEQNEEENTNEHPDEGQEANENEDQEAPEQPIPTNPFDDMHLGDLLFDRFRNLNPPEDRPPPDQNGLLGQLAEAGMPIDNAALNDHDNEVIQRLANYGYDPMMVVQVYLACDKNEEDALSCLMSM